VDTQGLEISLTGTHRADPGRVRKLKGSLGLGSESKQTRLMELISQRLRQHTAIQEGDGFVRATAKGEQEEIGEWRIVNGEKMRTHAMSCSPRIEEWFPVITRPIRSRMTFCDPFPSFFPESGALNTTKCLQVVPNGLMIGSTGRQWFSRPMVLSQNHR
jgi:hypothetical protein